MLENYTNLSQTFLLTNLIASSSALGIGFVIAFRFLPVYRRIAGNKPDKKLGFEINDSLASDSKKLTWRAGTTEKKRNNGL